MRYDYTNLYNRNASFLARKPTAKKFLLLFNGLIFYVFFIAYALLFLYGAKKGNFAPSDFVTVFFLPAFALLAVSVLQLAIARPRPYEEEGAGVLPLKKKEGSKNSFPSRHLTCAAVIAAVYLPYLPAVSAMLFLFAFVLGYARFAIGWHYPTDLFAGFVLGLAIGLLPMFI